MSHPGKLRALLATLRIANAPSVVSNVFLGFMVGWIHHDYWNKASMPWYEVSIACLAGLMLYFSGNLANDWFDRAWDAEKRPERALPSGLFRPSSYVGFFILLAAGGIGLAFCLHLFSGLIAVTISLLIAAYTYFHKRAIWAVIPMGLCRAGLYLLGFFASWCTLEQLERLIESPSVDSTAVILGHLREPLLLASGLFFYIMGLSLSARYEGMENPPQGPKVISLMLLFLPICAMSSGYMGYNPLFGVIGMIPFIVWLTLCLTRFKKPIPRYVSALLAGIPLVDLIAATPIALGLEAHLVEQDWGDLPHIATMIVVPVVAFIAGRALQKLAPAT